MTKIRHITGAEGFTYSDAPQRSPEWLAIRASRIGASEIGDYMAKGLKGQYLASRKEIEKKIAFSKTFGVPFEKYANGAMQAGIDNEDFVADQYSSVNGVALAKVGCFYNDWFVASPDRDVIGTDGLVEIKWLFDSEWLKLLQTRQPKAAHYDQMQGQMWSTDKQWVDYVAGNGNTGRFIVIRVLRDEARIAEIMAERESVLAIEPLAIDCVFEFTKEAPQPVITDNPWED
jgi:predicted phage-related endonuclease